ncbi:hypothetical protein BMF77_pc00018 (plasmid) [Dolichospermum sp. UHCC 0315A]|uniref:hypothetical protein n=1 Tax=Dolichospermum sp. UHCC 0315A TaxID=1914871 RepID=UPI00125BA447|nr:hypothetical protein [Dolichospermum sp. UHCC 0315A]QEI44449.1 hypothetical protein BMF77_pc00018 [Dolichospermum sp. UHCC 0315A]
MNPNILNELETKTNDITGASLSLTFLYSDNIENQVNKDDVIERLSLGAIAARLWFFINCEDTHE